MRTSLLFTLGLFAQTTVYVKPFNGVQYHILPQIVPTSLTDVVTADAYLEDGSLTTGSASAVCVIQDKQGSPLPAIPPGTIAANSAQVFQFNRRWMPGGISWYCSVSGVTGYFTFRK